MNVLIGIAVGAVVIGLLAILVGHFIRAGRGEAIDG